MDICCTRPRLAANQSHAPLLLSIDGTDGRTTDRYINPVPHTVHAASINYEPDERLQIADNVCRQHHHHQHGLIATAAAKQWQQLHVHAATTSVLDSWMLMTALCTMQCMHGMIAPAKQTQRGHGTNGRDMQSIHLRPHIGLHYPCSCSLTVNTDSVHGPRAAFTLQRGTAVIQHVE